MKKISRLMALLLALIMLSSVAFATEEVIERDSFNYGDYALMLAAAEDANAAVGKTAVTNEDGVDVYNSHSLISGVKYWNLDKGTVVTITSYEVDKGFIEGLWDSNWYGVSYEQNGETRTGYIQTKYLTIQKPVPEIGYTPWDGTSETVTLTCSADSAASYEWQRGVAGEDGAVAWETIEGATSAELTLEATPENLKYAYRCVANDTSSDEVMLISPELAQWIAETDNVSGEMLTLAAQATTLDSMMLVGNQLIHVRTGEAFAEYNEETGVLTHIELKVPFGKVVDGAIVPLTTEPEAEPAA